MGGARGGCWDLPSWLGRVPHPAWACECATRGTVPAVSRPWKLQGFETSSREVGRGGGGMELPGGTGAHCWLTLILGGGGTGGEGGEGTAPGQWEQHTVYVGEGAEGSSGTAARLLHVVALGRFIDLEGRAEQRWVRLGQREKGSQGCLQHGWVSLEISPFSSPPDAASLSLSLPTAYSSQSEQTLPPACQGPPPSCGHRPNQP